MGYITKTDLSSETTIKLGGVDPKTKKKNPTSIEGYYIGSKVTKDTGYGPGLLHFFQTEAGNVGVWGVTRLNGLLTSDLVGQMVLATFTGMSPKVPGKNPAYLFNVKHDPENTIDVSGLNISGDNTVADAEEDGEDPTAYTASDDEGYEEGAVDEEETPVDETPPKRAAPPARPAVATDKARADRVKALLNGGGRKTA